MEEVTINKDKPARSVNPYDQPQHDAAFMKEVLETPEAAACELSCNPDEIQPVCGSDGRTYLNPCLLEHYSCLSFQRIGKHPVRVKSWGYCPAIELDPAEDANHFRPHDPAPDGGLWPVRNSNCKRKGQTELCSFANVCLYGGRCTRKGADDDADYVGKYRQAKSICSCEHLSCEQTWNDKPVCGDDGSTYRSECFLRRAACESQSPKKVLFFEACRLSRQVIISALAEVMCPPSPRPGWQFLLAGCTATGNTPQRPPQKVARAAGMRRISLRGLHLLLLLHTRIALLLLTAGQQQQQHQHRVEVQELGASRNNTCFRYRFPDAPRNPCQDYTCSFNAWCVPSADLLSPTCVCHSTCYDVGDAIESMPVCGSNGVDYDSLCHLKREACTMLLSVTVRKFTNQYISIYFTPLGDADPCDSIQCPSGAVCQLTDDRKPVCRCRMQCSLTTQRPVCASDGRTYPNACAMNENACRTGQHLKVLFDHSCTAAENPCLGQTCSWTGEQCRVDTRGGKQCVCRETCPRVVVPVCGSDGITYDSVCVLERAACLQKKHVWVVHAGQCPQTIDECVRYGRPCKGYEVCIRRPVVKSGLPSASAMIMSRGSNQILMTPQCTCPICPEDGLGNNVCGTDNRTYRSECHLRAAACRTKQLNLRVQSRGPCEECSKNCPIGLMCLDGKCVCRETCPKSGLDQEVCGTDGRIYPSVCELRRQACLQKTTIKIDGSGVVCRKSPLMRNRTAEFQSDDALIDRCHCNKIGSRDPYCDEDGTCRCHWGVEGQKCDHCVEGYWGISNGKPCISCSCNRFGSQEIQSCDSHSGQCKCKEGITGQQCSICPNGDPVTSKGCPGMDRVKIPSGRRQDDGKEIGLFFGASTSALIPFEDKVEADISLHLNMTPLSANGEIYLLSFLPREGPGRRFLKLRLTDAHLELAYFTGPKFAKMNYLVTREKVALGEPMAVHCVLKADESLRITTEEAGRREFGQDYLGKMISDNEYKQLLESQYDGLVVGCPSTRSDQHPSCGFSGCLTGIGAELTTPDGLERYVDLLSSGRGRHLRWIRAPEGATLCETSVLRRTAWSDHYGVDRSPVEEQASLPENQTKVTIIPEFNGQAYIRLDGPTGQQALKKRRMTLQIIFTRSSNDGIILAIPPSQPEAEFLSIRAEADDCVKIHLRVGRLSRFYKLPIYPWLLTKFQPRERIMVSKICSVVHSRWHNLTIDKKTRQYTVYLNGKKMDQQTLLTSFDLSHSPLYLGGIPQHETNLKVEESIVTNNFFVGAIQKVEINGAELVLAGPHPSNSATEHWENVSQWQGPPCGEDFASCDSEPLRKICRPHGEDYTCSCSTPLVHAVFVQRLTNSLAGVDLSIQEQKRISTKAEELACAERMGQDTSRVIQGQIGEVQHDVPEDSIIRSFSQKGPPRQIENNSPAGQDLDALKFRTTVNFNGSTILKYRNMLKTRDRRVMLTSLILWRPLRCARWTACHAPSAGLLL
ncbi:unnamed protein product [Schistocephalus solidus]|uniref:Agrin n=1 Tax=Schistocephalus solidus TaxID=70667 RepID=A0A183SFE4_SCHSO|nr:unnamed protein product [Schistocephalus solidus]